MLGRNSYGPGAVMDYVLSFKKDLTRTDIEVITRDVSEHLCEDPDTPQRNHWEAFIKELHTDPL
jgi:hypothetical protein